MLFSAAVVKPAETPNKAVFQMSSGSYATYITLINNIIYATLQLNNYQLKYQHW